MKGFTKYISVISRQKVEDIPEPLPIFGVDIYCSKNKEEAKRLSSFFNHTRTIEICEVIEEYTINKFDYCLN